MRIASALPAVLAFRKVRERRLASQAVGNAGLNAATLVLNFVIALVLSRTLGSTGYGAYAFALAWTMLLAIPGVLGLPSIIVRQVAVYRVRGERQRVRGLLRWANAAVLISSGAISATAALIMWALHWPADPLFTPTLVGLLLVPLVAVVSIRQSAMQGFGAVVLGRTPEAVVAPLVTIALVLALAGALTAGLTPTAAVAAHVIGLASAGVLGVYLLRRTLPTEVRRSQASYEGRAWLVASLPLLLMGGIQALNAQAGTILTGALAGSEATGVFSISVRISSLLQFLLVAMVPALMPTIASLYEQERLGSLQSLLTKAARVTLFASLPFVVIVFLFAEWILGVFGDDFTAGVWPLRLLCLGQLVNVATGFAGTVLIMIGDSASVVKAAAASSMLNIGLCASLIPLLDVSGAAIAGGFSVIVMNALTAYLLWRRSRIYTPALGVSRAVRIARESADRSSR